MTRVITIAISTNLDLAITPRDPQVIPSATDGKGVRAGVAVLRVEAFQDKMVVMFLRDVEFPCWTVPVDVEAKEVAGRSRVGAFELCIELALEIVQGGPVVASDELVVNMDREHEEVVSLSARVETWVCLGRTKPWDLSYLLNALLKQQGVCFRL